MASPLPTGTSLPMHEAIRHPYCPPPVFPPGYFVPEDPPDAWMEPRLPEGPSRVYVGHVVNSQVWIAPGSMLFCQYDYFGDGTKYWFWHDGNRDPDDWQFVPPLWWGRFEGFYEPGAWNPRGA